MGLKKLIVFFVIISLINIFIFFFKDKFQYIKYSTYKELYADCDDHCRQKWNAFLTPYPAAELTEAREILSPLQLDTASTLYKISSIGHHLYAKFSRQAGTPEIATSMAGPAKQYRILAADSNKKLWCGTYVQMFNFFCWSQNIVCRNVEIFKPGDHHLVNECFVPELKQWILVDLTHGIISMENKGRLLNAQDFVDALDKREPVSVLKAIDLKPQSLYQFAYEGNIEAYYKKNYSFYYYHITKTETVYKTGAKLKRYIFPYYWYEIFNPVTKPNTVFYLKPFFIILWLVSLGSVFIKLINK